MTPLVLIEGTKIAMKRVPYADEAELRDLIAVDPEVLPIRDAAGAFDGQLIVLGTECQTSAGPVDVLLMNEAGLLTLVETKLVKNPEQKRTVLAQCLDYVLGLPRDYDAYEAYFRKHRGDPTARLFDAFEHEGIEEDDFRATVEDNLRARQVLVMIVGDRIKHVRRLGEMAAIIERALATEAVFAIAEIGVFEGACPTGTVRTYAAKVHGRTEVVTRTVIRVEDARGERLAADVATVEDARSSTQASPKSTSAAAMTADVFRARLAEANAESVWTEFLAHLPMGALDLDRKPTLFKVILQVRGLGVPMLYMSADGRVVLSGNARSTWEKTDAPLAPLEKFTAWFAQTFASASMVTSPLGRVSYRLPAPGIAGREAEVLGALRTVAAELELDE